MKAQPESCFRLFFLSVIALFVGKTQRYNIYSYEKRNKITFIPTNNAKIELVKI